MTQTSMTLMPKVKKKDELPFNLSTTNISNPLPSLPKGTSVPKEPAVINKETQQLNTEPLPHPITTILTTNGVPSGIQNPSTYSRDKQGNIVETKGTTWAGLSEEDVTKQLATRGTSIPSGTDVKTDKQVQEEQYQNQVLNNIQAQTDIGYSEAEATNLQPLGRGEAIEKASTQVGLLQRITKEQVMKNALISQAKSEAEIEVYEQGLTWRQNLASVLEGVPSVSFAGTTVRAFKGIAGESPSDEVKALKTAIDNLVKNSAKYPSLVQSGSMSPQLARVSLEKDKIVLTQTEAKIRMLINFSPELKSSPSTINDIQTDIIIGKKTMVDTENILMRF